MDCIGENGMRKGAIIAALTLVSLLAFNGTAFMAFADAPTIVIYPVQGLIGESFNFDITATSWSTVSEIKVRDPNGDTWVLKGWINNNWVPVTITLEDVGDSVRLTWPGPGVLFSVLNDPDNDVSISSTNLAWMNSAAKTPHTSVIGTYGVLFAGSGCQYFDVKSFYVAPEGLFGTLSFLLICVASLVMYKRVRP